MSPNGRTGTTILPFSPGVDPVGAFQQRLAQLPDERPALLVIDQLEELLTLSGREERDAFLTTVGDALRRDSRLWMVATLHTTFRRHFPDIVRDIADTFRAEPPATRSSTSCYDRLVARNARLKRRNRGLTALLTLAAVRIQQVTQDNRRLTQELESSTGITHIASLGRRRT
ncbi:hypothetical protein ACFV2N_47795 [Streptomyces sp. NPDC059680]|uniref:nSTAND1 domain-containing NTPase n=1 Tax=Streptomyces sp. NPDC059680 TaxID=3346904 RepID=UPI0036AE1B28